MKRKVTSLPTVLTFFVGCFCFLGCEQEYSESSTLDDIRSQENYEIDLKVNHDLYCDWLCDSLDLWRLNTELNTSKISVLWMAIVQNASSTLSIDIDDVVDLLSGIEITETNYTTVYQDKYALLSINQKAFIDELEDLFIEVYEESDLVLLDSLEDKRVHWLTILPADEVNATIDIARSSMVYWKHNIGCVFPVFRANKKECGARLAAGDLVGALWGSIGGAAGALLGAVGGTLGSAIDMAISGDCQD